MTAADEWLRRQMAEAAAQDHQISEAMAGWNQGRGGERMSETEAPKPAPQPQWQIIQGEPVSAYYLRTARLPVPGGWLYRVEAPGDPPTMCFVPAPPRGQGLP